MNGLQASQDLGPHDTGSGTPGRVTKATGVIRGLVSQNWLVGVLVLLIIGFSITSPGFFSQANLLNVTATAVAVCLLAVAQTFLLIAGQIDLSQGATMAVSGIVAGYTVSKALGGADAENGELVTAAAIGISIAVGGIVGALNGVVVAIFRLNPFIVTLGTLQICTGVANLLSNGQDITDLPPQVGRFGNTNLLGWLPLPAAIAIVVFVVLAIVLKKTRFGKYVYVIGDSSEAALRAGIRVKRHLIILFILSGMIAGLAGALTMARLSDAAPTAGQQLLFTAIASAVIGGTSLAGGRGTVGRTIVGGLIITVLLIGLVIAGIQPYWQQVAVGAVLVVAVYLDERGRGSEAKLRSKLSIRVPRSTQ